MFFVSDAQLTPQRTTTCPACDGVVKAPPAGKAAAGRPAPAASSSAPAVEDGPAPASRKKLFIIVGAAAALLIVIGIVLAVALSGPTVDYEKEAAKAVQARKKAFEDIDSKPTAPSAAPQAPAPAKIAPASAPLPAAPVRPAASEVRPRPPLPAAPAPASAPQTAPSSRPGAAIGPDVVARVRSDVLTLHPYYLSLLLTPAEKVRLDGISASGKGLPEDADFVQQLLTGSKLKCIRDEIAGIAQTIPTLDRESQEGLPTDRVTMNDGRVMNCRILEESPEVVKISRALSGGVAGQLPLRRENINKIEKGKGIGTEFTTRWESAQKGTTAGLVELLVWCKENALTGQGRLVAYTILKADPSNTQARAEAGLSADPVKNADEVARGGIIAYQGRNWPVRELKEKFLKDGYALMDGQWYMRNEKMISMPGLFRYEREKEKPVILSGSAAVCHDTDIVYRSVQDPVTQGWNENQEIRNIRRFYAPPMAVALTSRIPPGISVPPSSYELSIRLEVDEGNPGPGAPMKGEVVINVPIGAPLLEASVMTAAEVKAGGSIVVYHSTGSGDNEKRTKLYVCDAKESQSHPIAPDLIRGMTEINLVAVIEEPSAYFQKVERRHVHPAVMKGKYQQTPAEDAVHHRLIPDYKAVLFPSKENTFEVFRVKAIVAEPAAWLNKLFAANPDALK
jgi:hypothetical protein